MLVFIYFCIPISPDDALIVRNIYIERDPLILYSGKRNQVSPL